MRLFFAIDISEDVRLAAEKLIHSIEAPKGTVKWIQPDNLHITLKFLGETTSGKLEAIISASRMVASTHESMSVQVSGLGVFPDKRKPRIVWLGIKGDTTRMQILAGDLDEVMVQEGFEEENRTFSPHITIGRVRDPKAGKIISNAIADHQKTGFGSFVVDKLLLYESRLRPEGPLYTVVSEFPLMMAD
ncbi:MAG: RNA 2',3'-cyclic phosphodiesterase [Nitrospinota bacterium]|nr:RNA 2',3'-cyclic phosphodiesterase [Nitrospinota bacterium]